MSVKPLATFPHAWTRAETTQTTPDSDSSGVCPRPAFKGFLELLHFGSSFLFLYSELTPNFWAE